MWVAQHVSYLCSSSFHTFVSVAGVNVVTSICIYPVNSGQSVGQWWNMNSILYIFAEEVVQWCEVRGTRWPSDRTVCANQFSSETFNPKSPKLHCENLELFYLGGIACHSDLLAKSDITTNTQLSACEVSVSTPAVLVLLLARI